jgi:hypothetical protein
MLLEPMLGLYGRTVTRETGNGKEDAGSVIADNGFAQKLCMNIRLVIPACDCSLTDHHAIQRRG